MAAGSVGLYLLHGVAGRVIAVQANGGADPQGAVGSLLNGIDAPIGKVIARHVAQNFWFRFGLGLGVGHIQLPQAVAPTTHPQRVAIQVLGVHAGRGVGASQGHAGQALDVQVGAIQAAQCAQVDLLGSRHKHHVPHKVLGQ